jgi:hypothetical protein
MPSLQALDRMTSYRETVRKNIVKRHRRKQKKRMLGLVKE